MRERAVQAYARAAVPVEDVWVWLADASSWSSWTMLTRTELEQKGEPEPDGVGAIRRFGRPGGASREQVIEFDAPHHLAYVILSGMPVRSYRADVDLSVDGDGTLISWRARFEPKTALLGWPLERFFTFVLGGFARALAGQAAKRPLP
jgi:hypothetical protein